MAGMSAGKARKAKRLATGSGNAKSAIPGVPAPRSSGKPLSKREEKKVATNRLKNAASQMARSNSKDKQFDFADSAGKAKKNLASAQVKAVEVGVSARKAKKAVSKGYAVVSKRAKKDEKSASKTDKKYAGMAKAVNKASKSK